MTLTVPSILALNTGLGTLVVAAGFWLLWGTVLPAVMVAWTLLAGGFLWWRGRTVTEIWAWSTLLVGLESFAWPLILMIQMKTSTANPSDEEMGNVLSAVVLGLLASVFWLSFSYGLFKRAWAAAMPAASESVAPSSPGHGVPRKKKR